MVYASFDCIAMAEIRRLRGRAAGAAGCGRGLLLSRADEL